MLCQTCELLALGSIVATIGHRGLRASGTACGSDLPPGKLGQASMSHTLLAFHGFTMNAELMHDALGPLVAALAPKVQVVCLNAPHACSAATVERMSRGPFKPLSAPHLSWWNASEDGLEYRGWDDTRDLVREALDRYAPASILGFSQGAILAAAVAALAQSGEL